MTNNFMRMIEGHSFYKVSEAQEVLKSKFGYKITKSHLRYKLEVLECYIRVGNIMLIPEDFLKYLTLSLLAFKNNEKYKFEIKREVREKMPKFRELIAKVISKE
ncbi:hypothetical protein BHO_0014500 (plasmid) [Borrelia hermsii YBT]|uniref:Uncharacterized protein n=1 Tax=Borrelia hermsii YBT TaxID=1313295 RepID=W5T3K4_BORHE|nr:hypothetical protein BHO_0014500 [Borrelia hermsii YBT]